MIKVVLDCIVDPNSLEDEQILNRLTRIQDLASSLSLQCQFLVFTNYKSIYVENTGNTEVCFLNIPRNIIKRGLSVYRLKKMINKWAPDVILHRGMLPYFKKQNNVLFIQSNECLNEYSSIKKIDPKKIYAASGFIQQQLIHRYEIPLKKVDIIPFAIHPLYKKISWEQKENIKANYSNGTEFFLYNHTPALTEDFISILKAFSVFKKRLQTGMKLLIPSGLSSLNKNSSELLENYRYKEDVLFTGTISMEQLAELTAAAYAVINNGEKEAHSQLQDIVQCSVPVLILQPEGWVKDELFFEYADTSSAEEVAGKLMLLYKDEKHRNQLINSSQQLLTQFSREATAKTFHEALLRTVAE